jgi:ribosome-associated translation inhibitor RaiA
MKTILTYTSLDTQAPWPTLLTQQLDHWHSLATITAAEVVLEHQRHDGLAFCVKVRLEVSGPSLRAEARDSTLEGALHLATRDVERQIEARKAKPVGPEKSAQQTSAVSRSRTSHRA